MATNYEEKFNKRLMDAMSDMENPTKSKKADVGKFSYKYESLEEVLGIVRPALLEHGLMLTQGMKYHEPTDSFVLETGVFDENETRILDTRRMPNCQDAQQAGSWETYMRRYALRTAFGLTGEDDDGAATLGKKTSTEKPMTEKQRGMLMNLVAELAELRGKSNDDVIEGLMATKTMNGATFETLTTKQASSAIEQLIAWKSKANDEMLSLADEAVEDQKQLMNEILYDEDVKF